MHITRGHATREDLWIENEFLNCKIGREIDTQFFSAPTFEQRPLTDFTRIQFVPGNHDRPGLRGLIGKRIESFETNGCFPNFRRDLLPTCSRWHGGDVPHERLRKLEVFDEQLLVHPLIHRLQFRRGIG